MMFNREWRTTELAALKQHYPIGGAELCAAMIPGRTVGAIHRMAFRNGINAPHSMEIVKMKQDRMVIS